ncbi:unnamed protein product [Pleuronectes platessa]|uniref:Uncharacterized protein n=1 Tax=Pleuronectes platessa TaxID=8262 RepID=A0A9N7ZEB2_PLEPL|nr:unnamed protein product [Pleuronectes platessa]
MDEEEEVLHRPEETRRGTVLITGGNSGIGKETAVALALRGARVIIACRDVDKAEKAVREIKFKSRSLNVLHMELDLGNLRSVREFSKSFLQREKRLDILINNAGMPSVLDWTDERLQACASASPLRSVLPSRVITLTCSTYKYQKLDFQDPELQPAALLHPTARSKLANIYFSQELAASQKGRK